MSELHLFSQGVAGSEGGCDCWVCSGMKGGMVRAGVDRYDGRDKKGCGENMEV